MAQFQYEGVDNTGRSVGGIIEAADRRAAIADLAQKGHFAMSLSLAKGRAIDLTGKIETGLAHSASRMWARRRWSRISGKDILAFTSQLGTALKAGLPLMNCLEVIEQQADKAAMKRLLTELTQAVKAGKSLSEAMEGEGKIFSSLYLAMVRVGETGGILDATMEQLTGILRRDEQIKTNMKNASAYPLFVLGLGVASIILVVSWLLPKIIATIAESGALLPLPTQILLAVSGFIGSYGWLVGAAVVIGVILMKKWINSPGGRTAWDAFRLRIPILGRVQKTIAVGRFARSLGALTRGGITILESLQVVRNTLGNEVLARKIDGVAKKVKAGDALAPTLGQAGGFPPLLVQIVAVGEQTGKLDELLLGAADTFDEEADAAISKVMSILPAVLVLLLAVVIGFIIAATLLPIISMELGASAM